MSHGVPSVPVALPSFIRAPSRLIVDFHLKCPPNLLQFMSRHDSFLGCRSREMSDLSLAGGKDRGSQPARPVARLVSSWDERMREFRSLVVTMFSGLLGAWSK